MGAAEMLAKAIYDPPCTHIRHATQSFLIMEQPTMSSIDIHVELFIKFNVKHLVRVCETQSYDSENLLARSGAVSYPELCTALTLDSLQDLSYPDGLPPPEDTITAWLLLCEESMQMAMEEQDSISTIAIHCVSGLGRSCVMVAVALI